MTPEGRIKQMVNKAIADVTQVRPGKIWRFMPVQRGMGKPALDYILCVNGYFLSIETKKGVKSILTAQQQITKRDMERAGGIVLIVNDQSSCFVFKQVLYQLIDNPEQFNEYFSLGLEAQQGTRGPPINRDGAAFPGG